MTKLKFPYVSVDCLMMDSSRECWDVLGIYRGVWDNIRLVLKIKTVPVSQEECSSLIYLSLVCLLMW